MDRSLALTLAFLAFLIALTLAFLAFLLALTLALAPRAQAQETPAQSPTQMADFWGWLGVPTPNQDQNQAQVDQAWDQAQVMAWWNIRGQIQRDLADYRSAVGMLSWAQQRAQDSMNMDEVKAMEALARMSLTQAEALASKLALEEKAWEDLTRDIGKARAEASTSFVCPW
ncbi:MAG: hypothetical protein WC291_02650 [Thermodesulfovibrionales bacterium]|jgi:hypothetical protein